MSDLIRFRRISHLHIQEFCPSLCTVSDLATTCFDCSYALVAICHEHFALEVLVELEAHKEFALCLTNDELSSMVVIVGVGGIIGELSACGS